MSDVGGRMKADKRPRDRGLSSDLRLPTSDFRLPSSPLAGPQPSDAAVRTDRTADRAGRLEVTRERVRLAVPVHRERHVAVAAQGKRPDGGRRQAGAGHDTGETPLHVVQAPAAADRAITK